MFFASSPPNLALAQAQAARIVPARAARGLRVRRDHLDAVLDQVAPVLDALRVALADEEDDGRGVGRRSCAGSRCCQSAAILPASRRSCRCRRASARVTTSACEAVDDGARLGAGAAMRLLDGDGLAGLLLPVGGEGRVVGLVELAGRIVGDVEDGGVGRAPARQAEARRARRRRRSVRSLVWRVMARPLLGLATQYLSRHS